MIVPPASRTARKHIIPSGERSWISWYRFASRFQWRTAASTAARNSTSVGALGAGGSIRADSMPAYLRGPPRPRIISDEIQAGCAETASGDGHAGRAPPPRTAWSPDRTRVAPTGRDAYIWRDERCAVRQAAGLPLGDRRSVP